MRKWSEEVIENSNALDLEKGVFTLNEPKEIAQSLKKSAVQSKSRKVTPLRSAMLEDLFCYLVENVPGILFTERNQPNAFLTQEVDIAFLE